MLLRILVFLSTALAIAVIMIMFRQRKYEIYDYSNLKHLLTTEPDLTAHEAELEALRVHYKLDTWASLGCGPLPLPRSCKALGLEFVLRTDLARLLPAFVASDSFTQLDFSHTTGRIIRDSLQHYVERQLGPPDAFYTFAARQLAAFVRFWHRSESKITNRLEFVGRWRRFVRRRWGSAPAYQADAQTEFCRKRPDRPVQNHAATIRAQILAELTQR